MFGDGAMLWCRLKAGFVLACLVLPWGPGTAATPERCGFRPLQTLSLPDIEPEFRRGFCSAPSSPVCARRWKNVSGLMVRLAADRRISNIAMASYLLATTYVETGTLDFDPSAVERIGPRQRRAAYYPDYIGRGWVQLTYREMYAKVGRVLGLDLVNRPELALDPDHSYEILVRTMLDGLLETYRSTAAGDAGSVPIKLGDFVNATAIDYERARAVINANCVRNKPCADSLHRGKGYIPEPAQLDAGELGGRKALVFETLLCRGSGYLQQSDNR